MKRLRVWWIPQVPMKAFYAEVRSLREAKLLLNTLADYDLFQLENNIKPDYANVGGLQELGEDGDWTDWCDEESGASIDNLDMQECEEFDRAAGVGA
jgi:hypothetical protein